MHRFLTVRTITDRAGDPFTFARGFVARWFAYGPENDPRARDRARQLIDVLRHRGVIISVGADGSRGHRRGAIHYQLGLGNDSLPDLGLNHEGHAT
jgi:hypothetical protein